MASATELLASHCIEMAEQAGAGYERVASAVQSAVDVTAASDLMTLTAAAATGTLVREPPISGEPDRRHLLPPP